MKINIQKNSNDCGLYVIQALYNHLYSENLDIDLLRNKIHITKKGIDANELISLGKINNIKLEGFHVEFKDLMKNKNNYFVCLIKQDNNYHYVIVKILSDYIQVYDPAKGKYKMLPNEFKKIFNNVVLTFEKTEKEKHIKNNLLELIFKEKITLIWVTLSILISIIFSISSMFLMKVIFDQVLPFRKAKLLNLLMIVFVVVGTLKAINILIRKIFIKKISLKIEFSIFKKFSNKINSSYYQKISSYNNSDLQRRLLLINSVAIFITTSIFVVFQESMMLIISFSLMFWISSKLMMIVLAINILFILITCCFHFLIRKNISHVNNNVSNYFLAQNDYLNSIFNLKENKYFNKYKSKFIQRFINMKNSEFKIWNIFTFQNFWFNTIFNISQILIIFLCVKEIFNESISPGSLLFFLTGCSLFNGSVQMSTDYFLKISQNLKNMKMINEILNLQDEEINLTGKYLQKIRKISLKNLSLYFGSYQALKIDQLLIDSCLHLTGKNGSGKTTLLKTLNFSFSNLDSIVINDSVASEYNLNSLREKSIYISPHEWLWNESVIESICLTNENKNTFIKNIEKFDIDKLLQDNDISIHDHIENNAANFSSGQKQIITLLKLLACKYDLILLDEALENVDNLNLNILKNAIMKFQSDAIFIEVSHNKKYITDAREINVEQINKNK